MFPVPLIEVFFRKNGAIWRLGIDELVASGLLDLQCHLCQVVRRQLIPILDDEFADLLRLAIALVSLALLQNLVDVI